MRTSQQINFRQLIGWGAVLAIMSAGIIALMLLEIGVA